MYKKIRRMLWFWQYTSPTNTSIGRSAKDSNVPLPKYKLSKFNSRKGVRIWKIKLHTGMKYFLIMDLGIGTVMSRSVLFISDATLLVSLCIPIFCAFSIAILTFPLLVLSDVSTVCIKYYVNRSSGRVFLQILFANAIVR